MSTVAPRAAVDASRVPVAGAGLGGYTESRHRAILPGEDPLAAKFRELGLEMQPSAPDCFSALVLLLHESGASAIKDVSPENALRDLWANALLFAPEAGPSMHEAAAGVGPEAGAGGKEAGPSWPAHALLVAAAELLQVRIACYTGGDGWLTQDTFVPLLLGAHATVHLSLKEGSFHGAVSPAPVAPRPAALREDAGAGIGGQVWLFFDLEATGLDPLEDHVTQIAATAYFTAPGEAALGQGVKRGEFTCRVRPGVPVTPGAEAVTGVGTAALAPYPDFGQQAPNFLEWLKALRAACPGADVILAAHNGFRYDYPMLAQELLRHDLVQRGGQEGGSRDFDPFSGAVAWDSLPFFRAQGHPSNKLGSLFEARFGAPLGNAHDARADTRALGRLVLAPARKAPSDADTALAQGQGGDFEVIETDSARLGTLLQHVAAHGRGFWDVYDDYARGKKKRPTQAKDAPPLKILAAFPPRGPATGGTVVNLVLENLSYGGISQPRVSASIESRAGGHTLDVTPSHVLHLPPPPSPTTSAGAGAAQAANGVALHTPGIGGGTQPAPASAYAGSPTKLKDLTDGGGGGVSYVSVVMPPCPAGVLEGGGAVVVCVWGEGGRGGGVRAEFQYVK